jgi:hypothetical protein
MDRDEFKRQMMRKYAPDHRRFLALAAKEEDEEEPTSFVIVDQAQAQKVVLEVYEVLKSDPDAKMPPSLAALMDAELNGMVWNFETGEFEKENS